MAISTKIKKGKKLIEINVGDRVRVMQKIKEGAKERTQAFEGIVIKIRGSQENKTFTVRRIGVGQVGIERIFPVVSPLIVDIEVVKEGKRGIRSAKLYYIRKKSKKEIEKIYSRAKKRTLSKKKSQEKKSKSSKASSRK